MQHRNTLFAVLITFAAALTMSPALQAQDLSPVHMVDTTDLSADAQLARYRQVPILVMFATEECGYCHIIEEEFLKPMLRNDAYEEKVLIRRVMLDDYGTFTDFDGSETTSDELASRYDARLTPTLVFLGPNGKELAPRIVGVQTVELYGWDLDNGIDTSLSKIRDLAYQDKN